jgi:hypothetical protein
LRGHMCQSGLRFHASAHDPISLNQRVHSSSLCAPTIAIKDLADFSDFDAEHIAHRGFT